MARNWKDEIFRLQTHANNCLANISFGDSGLEPTTLLAYMLSLFALKRQLHPVFNRNENGELEKYEDRMKKTVYVIRLSYPHPWIGLILSNNYLFSMLYEWHDLINDFCSRHRLTPTRRPSAGEEEEEEY